MSRRRRRQEEPENHERWLVSYADFITLLFAFFVVMYSISSVNEGKYRVLSDTLNAVFSAQPSSDNPIQIGERPRDLLPSPDKAPLVNERTLAPADQAAESQQAVDPQGDKESHFRVDPEKLRVADEIAVSLQDYVDQGLLRIDHVGDRIEIEMKEKMLFSSGEARLSRRALRALRAIAKTLTRVNSYLQIEGHTDNVPISTPAFPSNWELSAARAASVVHFLARAGVAPQRMSAVGRGEHDPIAENTDEAGRAANRRVKIIVLTGEAYQDPSLDGELPWAEAPAQG